MADFLIIDGDTVMFMPNFGKALVIAPPGKIEGSGPMTYKGKAVCVEGDESSVSVKGCMYMAAPYVIPGTGTLTIDKLAGDQVAKEFKVNDKAVILKGSKFTAKFEVQSPAQMVPPASSPDTTMSYSGSGTFTTTNTKFRGT